MYHQTKLQPRFQLNNETKRLHPNRTSMQSVQGPVIELSEERILLVINNIEKGFVRIHKLLSVEWKD